MFRIYGDSIVIDYVFASHHVLDGSEERQYDHNFKLKRYPESIFAPFYIDEFLNKMSKFNVKMEHNIATDEITHHIKSIVDELNKKEFDRYMDYQLSTCERRELQVYSHHMLYICRKTKVEKIL